MKKFIICAKEAKNLNSIAEPCSTERMHQETRGERNRDAERRLYEGEKLVPFDRDRADRMWTDLGIKEECIAAIESCGNGIARYHDNGGDRTLVYIDQVHYGLSICPGTKDYQDVINSQRAVARCIDTIQKGRKNSKVPVHILSEGMLDDGGYSLEQKNARILESAVQCPKEAHYLPMLVPALATRVCLEIFPVPKDVEIREIEKFLENNNMLLEHADRCGDHSKPLVMRPIIDLISKYEALVTMRSLLPTGWFNDEKFEKEARNVFDYTTDETEKEMLESLLTKREEIVLDKVKGVSRDSIPVVVYGSGHDFAPTTTEKKINLIRIETTAKADYDTNLYPSYREELPEATSGKAKEFVDFVYSLVGKGERAEEMLKSCEQFIHSEYSRLYTHCLKLENLVKISKCL